MGRLETMTNSSRSAAFPVLASALRELKSKATFDHFLSVAEGASGEIRIDVLPLKDLPVYAKVMAVTRPTGDGIVFVGPSGEPILTSLDQVDLFAHWTEQAEIAQKTLDRILEEGDLIKDVETLAKIAKSAYASSEFVDGPPLSWEAAADAVGAAAGIPREVVRRRMPEAVMEALRARDKVLLVAKAMKGRAERAGWEAFVKSVVRGNNSLLPTPKRHVLPSHCRTGCG